MRLRKKKSCTERGEGLGCSVLLGRQGGISTSPGFCQAALTGNVTKFHPEMLKIKHRVVKGLSHRLPVRA